MNIPLCLLTFAIVVTTACFVDARDSRGLDVPPNEECWNNAPNLTRPAALACPLLIDQFAYIMGGIDGCCPLGPAPATTGVKSMDLTDQLQWLDLGTQTPKPIRGDTTCALYNNQIALTTASADANSMTPATNEVIFVGGMALAVKETKMMQTKRSRAAMLSTEKYVYVIGGVDEDGLPVETVERTNSSMPHFEVFSVTGGPLCDCAVAVHQIEVFMVCSNCSSGGFGKVGVRNILLTVNLDAHPNVMQNVSHFPTEYATGPLVSIAGSAIAQYAVFLAFYAGSINPAVYYWDLYLQQLHVITTGWLTVPRTHGSVFVSQYNLFYAGGLYFPAPNQSSSLLSGNVDSIPVMQQVSFTALGRDNYTWTVGESIDIRCPLGFWFRLGNSQRCHGNAAGSVDMKCNGVDTPTYVMTRAPAPVAVGCLSPGTCRIPKDKRLSCGDGQSFRSCNREMGCCWDSVENSCFRYYQPNTSEGIFYQCASLTPLIVDSAQTSPPITPPPPHPSGTLGPQPTTTSSPVTFGPMPSNENENMPTPPPSSSFSRFVHSTTGQVALALGALVLMAAAALLVFTIGRSGMRRRSQLDLSDDMDLIHGKYHVVRKLGQGGFGSVFHVRRKTDNCEFALKYIPCQNDEDRNFALKEFELIRAAQGHENMVAIHDMFMNWSDDAPPSPHTSEKAGCFGIQVEKATTSPLLDTNRRFVCIVMTYCPGGDLSHYINACQSSGTPIAQDWILQILARQMIKVLHHLHERPNPIVHRDLKPENVLLSTNRQNVLLTDFGLAQEQMQTYMTTRAGSLHYVAPECWKKHYSSAVDMWAVGCIMYATATGRCTVSTARIMFNDAKERGFQKEIRNDLTFGTNHRYNDEFASFVLALLQVEPKKRLNANAALQWLDDIRDGVPRRGTANVSGNLSSSPKSASPNLRKGKEAAAAQKTPPDNNSEGDSAEPMLRIAAEPLLQVAAEPMLRAAADIDQAADEDRAADI
jgi:serine/threonine protein kinase